MDLTLYVYGNGELIYYILISVNFFMQKSTSFFELAGLVSLIIFAIQSTGMMPTKGYDWSRFFKVYLLISIFVLTPYPGATTVHDVITNDDKVFNFTNNKLPFGLIYPIATVSTVMNQLIKLYQENFEIDKNLNYTFSGMNFGANFIQSLDNVNSYDDGFNHNLDQYMQNCGFPLLNKAGALSELRNSTDIFATLANPSYTSAARFVQQVDFTSGKTTVIKPCNQAIADINTYYDNNKDRILQNNARRMGIATGSDYTHFIQSADATADTLMGISQGASAVLKQAIGMNMIMASVKNGAQSVGNGSLALAAYDAEQFQQYKTTSALSGAASARTIPILVGIAFALLFFLYPIMIFLAISAGSYRAIGVFFQIIMGINLIPLIYEILNYITTFYLEKKLGVVISGQGYTYDVSTSLYSFTDNMIIAGNYLATATPIMAFAIVTGSSAALTAGFGIINDPAKQQASQVGHEYSHGNLNMGNTSIDTHSYNNMQGNKLDDQFVMNSGAATIKTTTPGGINTNVGGRDYDTNHMSVLQAKPQFAKMMTNSLTNSLSQSHQEIASHAKQWSNNTSRLSDLSNQINSDSSASNLVNSEERDTLARAQSLSNSIDASLRAHAKVGISYADNGVGVQGDVSRSWSGKDSEELNRSLGEYKQYSEQFSHSSNQALRDAFSNGSSFADSTSQAVQDTISKEKALSDVISRQSSINTDYSNDFDSYLRNQGLDPNDTDMNASKQQSYAEKYVSDELNNKYGIKTNLANPSNNLQSGSSVGHSVPTNNGLTPPNSGAIGNSPPNTAHEAITTTKEKFGDGNSSPQYQSIKKVLDKAPDTVKEFVSDGVTLAGNKVEEIRSEDIKKVQSGGQVGKNGYPEYKK